jgi:hypothetical protein
MSGCPGTLEYNIVSLFLETKPWSVKGVNVKVFPVRSPEVKIPVTVLGVIDRVITPSAETA